MTMTQWWAPTVVRVSGDSTMRGQLLQTLDGSLICDFPERMVLIANHQIYTDWLYLWWIGYASGMHGRIHVILKESLKRIPVIGWGMQFSQFIFLKRKWEQDKPRLSTHLEKFSNRSVPMWLMMFPEGTNLADSTRESSKQWADKNGIKDMRHTLLPRSTGLQFVLQQLRGSVDYLYDCTIAYEGVPRGEFAQDIFTVGATYFGGRPPKSVNMYWRRFLISTIPLDNPKEFDLWLRNRWIEKDNFIEGYLRRGRFPADEEFNRDHKEHIIRGAGHIEAEIKPKYWYEFLQVFAPIGLLALVLYMFYGKLPQKVLDSIKSVDQKAVLRKIGAFQRGEIKIPDKKKLKTAATKALHEQNSKEGSRLKKAVINHGVVTLNGVPQENFRAQGLGDAAGTQATAAQVSDFDVETAPKVSASKKPVTFNMIPQRDFPTTGLGQKDRKKPTVAPKFTGTAKANHTSTPTALAKTSLRAKPSATAKARKGQQLQKNTPSNEPKSEQIPMFMLQPLEAGMNTKSTSQKLDVKPNLMAKKPVVRTNSSLPQKGTKSKSSASSVPSTALKTQTIEEKPEEKQVGNIDVRRARKKLELRQGRREPKRKTRRALETSASKT